MRSCQSCGMPMIREEDFGTEASGAPSDDYCTHCYQSGTYTWPGASIDEMAAFGGAILSRMYEIPPERATVFTREKLSCLKRWAGREVAACGSCGMPLARDGDAGTEADGSRSAEYCVYCYRDGAFTEPDLTREEAVRKYAPMMAADLEMPLEGAEEMVRQHLSTLPRWRE